MRLTGAVAEGMPWPIIEGTVDGRSRTGKPRLHIGVVRRARGC